MTISMKARKKPEPTVHIGLRIQAAKLREIDKLAEKNDSSRSRMLRLLLARGLHLELHGKAA